MSAVKIEPLRVPSKYSIIADARTEVRYVGVSVEISKRLEVHIVAPGVRGRATRTFNVLTLIIPPRISGEEIGDAMERISTMTAEDQPPWRIYFLMASTVFWVLVHAFHAIVRGLPKKKGG